MDVKLFSLQQGTCQYTESNRAATCSGWVDVKSGDELALQQAVATVGPIAVAIDASSFSFQVCLCGVTNVTVDLGIDVKNVHHTNEKS